MIRKLFVFTLFTFVILVQSFKAQSIEPQLNDCIQDFVISTSKEVSQNSPIDDIIISWDFRETEHNEKLKLIIEIQPLNACWNELDGTNRSEPKKFTVNNLLQNSLSKKRLQFIDFNSKCFKWKVSIVDISNTCEFKSDWQFTSFL